MYPGLGGGVDLGVCIYIYLFIFEIVELYCFDKIKSSFSLICPFQVDSK